jgi:hypothetical protein
MLAIQTVLFTSVVGIILSFMLYCNGYKRLGIDMFRGILGADLLWVMMVLMIGLAPMPR